MTGLPPLALATNTPLHTKKIRNGNMQLIFITYVCYADPIANLISNGNWLVLKILKSSGG